MLRIWTKNRAIAKMVCAYRVAAKEIVKMIFHCEYLEIVSRLKFCCCCCYLWIRHCCTGSINFELIEIEFLEIVYVHHYYTLRLLHDCSLISFLSFTIQLLLFIRIFRIALFRHCRCFFPHPFRNFCWVRFTSVCICIYVCVHVSYLKGHIFFRARKNNKQNHLICVFI